MEQEDSGVITLSFLIANSANYYDTESSSVWKQTNLIHMQGSDYELFTIPESRAFQVGIKIKNTGEICMNLAVSADGNVFPVGPSGTFYPAIGHSCTLDNVPYQVHRTV